MGSNSQRPHGFSATTTKTFSFSWGGTDWYTHNIEYDSNLLGSTSAHPRVVFDIELFSPSRLSLELPLIDQLSGPSRWVNVKAESGFIFKVFMKHVCGRYEFRRGFPLMVASECLQDEQGARFELMNDHTFQMWNDDYRRTNEPIGFSTGVSSSGLLSWTKNDFIVSRGTHLSASIISVMHQSWAASPVQSKMYVCTILKSHTPPGTMVFSREFSHYLPKKKMIVALRYIGSPVIIPGSIRKYDGHTAKISRGWALFAREHHIAVGQVIVFRIHRCSKGWEMIACR